VLKGQWSVTYSESTDMPSLEVYLGTDTAGGCCRVAKYTPVPIQPSSRSGQGVGRKLACKLGMSSQLLAETLRRAFLTCLPSTIATSSHNLQAVTQNAAGQALLEETCLCPIAMRPLTCVTRAEGANALWA